MARSKQIFNGDPTTRESILASARAEIDQYGIIGLRLSAVAEKAQVSVPLIYKYFEDRDGLLAVVHYLHQSLDLLSMSFYLIELSKDIYRVYLT